MDRDEAQPQLAAYALGALEGQEREDLERALRADPALREDLRGYQRTVANLPLGVEMVDPPASLKTRLLRRIELYEAERNAESQAAAGSESRSRWRSSMGGPLRSMAYSVAAVALLLVGWSVYQTVRVNDLQAQNDNLATDVRTLGVQNDDLATDVRTLGVQNHELVTGVKSLEDENGLLSHTVKLQWSALTMAVDPRVESVPFEGSEASPQTRGNLLVHAEYNRALLLVVDLRPPGRGEVYQVWMWKQGSGRFLNAGVFTTWAEGYGMWTFHPPMGSSTSARFGVTREPSGGSPAPTGTMLFTGDVPAVIR